MPLEKEKNNWIIPLALRLQSKLFNKWIEDKEIFRVIVLLDHLGFGGLDDHCQCGLFLQWCTLNEGHFSIVHRGMCLYLIVAVCLLIAEHFPQKNWKIPPMSSKQRERERERERERKLSKAFLFFELKVWSIKTNKAIVKKRRKLLNSSFYDLPVFDWQTK